MVCVPVLQSEALTFVGRLCPHMQKGGAAHVWSTEFGRALPANLEAHVLRNFPIFAIGRKNRKVPGRI